MVGLVRKESLDLISRNYNNSIHNRKRLVKKVNLYCPMVELFSKFFYFRADNDNLIIIP